MLLLYKIKSKKSIIKEAEKGFGVDKSKTKVGLQIDRQID